MNGIDEGISELEQILGYGFKDRKLALNAIHHPGLRKGVSSKKFERLEFLGDRVLGLSLSDFLYHCFPEETEGNLAVRIATLAGTDFLISLSKKTKMIECFRVPNDFYISNYKNSSSIADMVEAVFGAVFLDSGFKSAQGVILNAYKGDIEKIVYSRKDAKTRLQEIVQVRTSGLLPTYRLLKKIGEAHDPIFEIEASACGKAAIGHGGSKKAAEHNAAKKLIEILGD